MIHDRNLSLHPLLLYCIACTVSSSSRPVVTDQLHHCSAAITTNPTTSIYLHSLTPFLYPFHSIINLIAKSSSSPFPFFSSSLTLSSSLYPLLSPLHILLFYLPTSFFCFLESVQISKTKEYAQKYSAGTLYREGREKIMMSDAPMLGAYVRGTWPMIPSSSSSFTSSVHSSAYVASSTYGMTAQRERGRDGQKDISDSPASCKLRALREVNESDLEHSAISWDEAVLAARIVREGDREGDREGGREMTNAESIDLYLLSADNSMDELTPAIPSSSSSSFPSSSSFSSSSMRHKITMEKERADREFRDTWGQILGQASGMLNKGIGKSTTNGAGAINVISSTNSNNNNSICNNNSGNGNAHNDIMSSEYCHNTNNNNNTGQIQNLTQGPGVGSDSTHPVQSLPKGKTKKKDLLNSSSSSSTSSASVSSSSYTVSAAISLIEKAGAMKPYVNQPGENLAEIMRSVLGEVMTVRNNEIQSNIMECNAI